MVVNVAANLVELAFPEGFEDHPVSRLRPVKEAGDVERRIGCKQRTHPRAGGRQICEVTGIGGRLGRGGNGRGRALYTGVRIGGFQDRLLFMTRTLAKHAVEAKPDEQRNERKDDDYGQFFCFWSSGTFTTNIMRAGAESKAPAAAPSPLHAI